MNHAAALVELVLVVVRLVANEQSDVGQVREHAPDRLGLDVLAEVWASAGPSS